MLLARKDESRHWMSIEGLAGYNMMLTVAILSATALNFSNVWRKEEIQLTRLSVPLTADAVLWTGATTMLISEPTFFAASSSRAASAVVISGVSSRSDGVPCSS